MRELAGADEDENEVNGTMRSETRSAREASAAAAAAAAVANERIWTFEEAMERQQSKPEHLLLLLLQLRYGASD